MREHSDCSVCLVVGWLDLIEGGRLIGREKGKGGRWLGETVLIIVSASVSVLLQVDMNPKHCRV